MAYPHLFSEWQIHNTTIPNRVVFAPTCPTWVSNPYEGIFTDQAVAYYEERARGGCGLIMIGGTVTARIARASVPRRRRSSVGPRPRRRNRAPSPAGFRARGGLLSRLTAVEATRGRRCR
jgi:hypothetical protein